MRLHWPGTPLAWVVLSILLPFLLYFLFATAGKAVETYRFKRDEASLRKEIAELQVRYSELEAQREFYQSDAFIEQVARRDLGFIKPSERGVVIIMPEPEAESPSSPQQGAEPDLPRWRQWWDFLFGP